MECRCEFLQCGLFATKFLITSFLSCLFCKCLIVVITFSASTSTSLHYCCIILIIIIIIIIIVIFTIMGLVISSWLMSQTTSQCQFGDKDSVKRKYRAFSNPGRIMQEHVYMSKSQGALQVLDEKVRKVSLSSTIINI